MDEGKYKELVEWAVGVLERKKGVFVVYNARADEAERFANLMLEKIKEINNEGSILRNYLGECYYTENFPYKVEIVNYNENSKIREQKDLCLIVLDSEGKIGKDKIESGIDLGFFIHNKDQAA